MFEAKIRKVGTSVGLLVPKEIIEQEHLQVGQKVGVSLIQKKNIKMIEKMFGIAKGAPSFERDHKDRVF